MIADTADKVIKHGASQNKLFWFITATVSVSVSDNDAFSTIICAGFVCCVVFIFMKFFFFLKRRVDLGKLESMWIDAFLQEYVCL